MTNLFDYEVGSTLPSLELPLDRTLIVATAIDQPALLDRAIAPAVRTAVRVGSSPKNMTTALKVIAPMTGKVLERHLRDEQPLDPRVVTPAEIRERFPRTTKVPQAV